MTTPNNYFILSEGGLETFARQIVAETLKASGANIDNFTADSMNMPEGDINGMARIKQRVTLPNGEKVWCTGETVGDAIANLLSRLAINQPSAKHIPTLKEYGETWYTLYHVQKVKPNTAQNTRIYLDKHIYPLLGDKRLDEITHDDVQIVFNGMKDKARSTVEKVRITLNQILKNALEDGHVRQNVMDSSRYVISKKVQEREPLNVSEVQDIIAHLDMLEERDRVLIALATYTGMRRGEMLALTWDDVDFEKHVIHVRHSVSFRNNRPVVGGTKSKAGVRITPMNPTLESILKTCTDKQGYVIKNTRTPDTPMTEKTYQRTWERIGKTINLHGATAHIFRHTFATMMEPHTDIKTLQSIMGHADIQTTMNRYTHPIMENIQALSRINAFGDTAPTRE